MHPSHSAVARQQRSIRTEAERGDSYAFFNLLTGQDLLDDVEALLPAHRERLFPPTETLSMFLAQVLSSDGSCTQGFLTSFAADPLLDELSRPAGSVTWRLRPAHGAAAVMPSPALDVVPDMFCLEDDQHGVTRPNDLMDVINVDGACDIGAVEVVFSDVLFRDSFEIE